MISFEVLKQISNPCQSSAEVIRVYNKLPNLIPVDLQDTAQFKNKGSQKWSMAEIIPQIPCNCQGILLAVITVVDVFPCKTT